jgi:hypothetical protein
MEDLAADDIDVEDIGVDVDPSKTATSTDSTNQTGKSIFSRVKDLMTRSTGRGNLDRYRDKPLCFDNEQSTARIVRGVEGVLESDSNLWWIDVLMGILEKNNDNFNPSTTAPGKQEDGINENIAR